MVPGIWSGDRGPCSAHTCLRGRPLLSSSHGCRVRMGLRNVRIFQDKPQIYIVTWNLLILKCQLVILSKAPCTSMGWRPTERVCGMPVCELRAAKKLKIAKGMIEGGQAGVFQQ